ncbi:MAG: hypothetical protein J6Y74_04745 [Clostridia bacterium]|nr:hypothetical protein [Clostridia bacterium]
MDLSVMLEYQDLDRKLIKLESTLLQSEAAREYAQNKGTVTSAQEQVGKQNREAGEMIKQMDALIAEYEALEKELTEMEGAVPEVTDLNGAEFFSRNIQKLINQLKNLSQEIGKLSSRIVEMNQAHAATMSAGKEAAKKLNASKARYDEEKAKLMPEAKKLQAEIAEIEKKCTPRFLDVYKRLRKSKIPVVVPLQGGRSCGGCFMELAGDAIVRLNGENFIECPDCGRILYKA